MAIIKNRSKQNNIAHIIFKNYKRLLLRILLILSIFSIMHFCGYNKISNSSLEIVGYTQSALSPISKVLFTTVNFIQSQFVYLRNLKSENLMLKNQIAQLQSLNADRILIQNENTELKKTLNFIDNTKVESKYAKILGISKTSFHDMAFLSAGSNDGIKVHQIVTSGEWLVGIITQVSDNYSKAMLISDLNARIPVISLPSKVQAILSGARNGKITLKYTEEDQQIHNDDIIVTSGNGGLYPFGIKVGFVQKNNNNDGIVIHSGWRLHDTNIININNYTIK
ncbi:MAG: rod shape-determining protein MreC [Rickettsiaceae bacterium]